MSAKNEEREELLALREWLEDLKIVVSKNEGGVVNVASYSEPLFCFDCPDLESAQLVVIDTLRSYVKTFYHADIVEISTKSVPIEAPSIPIRRIEPEYSVKPSFGDDFTKRDELAVA
jgi:hypothetical protein